MLNLLDISLRYLCISHPNKHRREGCGRVSCVSSRNIVTCIQIKLIEYQGGGCDASVNIVMGMMIPGMLLRPGLAGEAGQRGAREILVTVGKYWCKQPAGLRIGRVKQR